MFKRMMKKYKFWKIMNQEDKKSSQGSPKQILSKDLEKNIEVVKGSIASSSDLSIRRFRIGWINKKAAIIFISCLIDKKLMNDNILRPLMANSSSEKYKGKSNEGIADILSTNILTVGSINKSADVDEIVQSLLSGNTVLIIESSSEALLMETRGWDIRSIEEPDTETVVRGPREGFIENLQTNLSLIRRKVRNKNLMIELLRLGQRTNTEVAVVYIKGIANDRIITEIKRRLGKIHTDAILESGYIEEFIEDNPFSLFPMIASTEKPDKITAKLLEGRAAILVDGSPFVLTVPYIFFEAFQSPEDYYLRSYVATFSRWLRFVAFMISLLAPAIYVALVNFHQELIPTNLIISIAAAREGVPFPVVVETIGMVIVFYLLREASIRMPRALGQAISIVGALVIGQAAVAAGLISAPVVIVISITAISIFLVPTIAQEALILSIIICVFSSLIGLLGIITTLLYLLVYLASLRSFGVPYLSPVAPLSMGDLKDVFVRAPLWAMFTRPRSIGWYDPQRQEFNLKPEPPDEGEGSSDKTNV